MARSNLHRAARQAEQLSFNMTPMIDVTFQLIIFFIVAGQMASQALAKLVPPKPWESQARELKKGQFDQPNRVIVNVLSSDPERKSPDPSLSGTALKYKVDAADIAPDDIDALVAILEQRKNNALADGFKEFFVEVRAHYTVYYRDVEPVLKAAAKAGIPKMSITARLSTPEE